MPQFQDPTDPESNPLVEVNYFWNRNLAGDLAAYDETHRCIAVAVRSEFFRAPLTTAYEYAKCKGMRFVYSVVQQDLVQSAYQFLSLRAGLRPPPIDDVNRLADLIKTYHTGWDAHVMTVTHSQGNMVFAQAIQQLPAKEGRPLQSQYCTAELSLAAPIYAADFGMNASFLRGIDVNGDILEVVGLPNDFPHIDNDTSRAAAADLATLIGSLPVFRQYKQLQWGTKIHGVDYNYFGSREGVAAVKKNLGELYDECMTGAIVPSQNSVTVPLGDSVKIGFTVLSRSGHVLLGRKLRGGGVHSVVNADSFVVSLGPTPAEAAPLTIYPWPTTPLGTLSVTVPNVHFPGHLVERRTTVWVETTSYTDNSPGSGTPPLPTSAPDWDGRPDGCTATTTTTSGNAWTLWGARCFRTYWVVIPANPLPGGARFRVKYADYPSGPFHGDSFTRLLEPNTVLDHEFPANYNCGPEYCLRAAILESYTPYELPVSSDTTCFSDLCGGSADRAPNSKPRLGPTSVRANGGKTKGGP